MKRHMIEANEDEVGQERNLRQRTDAGPVRVGPAEAARPTVSVEAPRNSKADDAIRATARPDLAKFIQFQQGSIQLGEEWKNSSAERNVKVAAISAIKLAVREEFLRVNKVVSEKVRDAFPARPPERDAQYMAWRADVIREVTKEKHGISAADLKANFLEKIGPAAANSLRVPGLAAAIRPDTSAEKLGPVVAQDRASTIQATSGAKVAANIKSAIDTDDLSDDGKPAAKTASQIAQRSSNANSGSQYVADGQIAYAQGQAGLDERPAGRNGRSG